MKYRAVFMHFLSLLLFASSVYPMQQTPQPPARIGQESVHPRPKNTLEVAGSGELRQPRHESSILELKFQEGEEVVLHSKSNDSVVIFDTLSAMRKATTAMEAKDMNGVKQLTQAGEVFTVSNNTKVLIVETYYFRTLPESVNPLAVLPMLKVRFLTGVYAGVSGWVSQGSVKLIDC
jgi:hypothetical protein